MAAKFTRLFNIQFLAADPCMKNSKLSSGSGAKQWGIWRVDPGPRGVSLGDFGLLESAGGVAPATWMFDPQDWWLEEHGLIMEKPEFPLPPGKYQLAWLNGPSEGRESVILTIHPDGDQWALSDRASLYNVTHLPCRSARYSGGLPSAASAKDFPVTPGATMPNVPGCDKQDYAVLFVTGLEEK